MTKWGILHFETQDEFGKKFIANLSRQTFILPSRFTRNKISLWFKDSQGFKCSNLFPFL